MSKFYKWTVEIQVSANWVADGVDLTSERMHDIMTEAFPHVYSHEIKCKTIAKPSDKYIAKEQGFRTVKEFRQARK